MKTKILVVGQTPPPFGGQAIMIQNLLAGSYEKLILYHARMNFSDDMDQVGKFRVRKVIKLIWLVAKIVYMRFRYSIKVIYYPPAGPDYIPMIRDIIVLVLTRYFFKKIIFHFHAGGISELYGQLSSGAKIFFRLAYFKPDLAIHLSDMNPNDGGIIMARNTVIIPYGIEDFYQGRIENNEFNHTPTLLYVGVVKESKGVMVLLDACSILHSKGLSFKLLIMGKFESIQFQEKVQRFIGKNGLKYHVEFLGVLSGKDKWDIFTKADILCFPSFFESETFGLVVLEAMQFKVPVIATKWRGIPSIIEDGHTGYLVPTKDSRSLAQKIGLLNDPELRKRMGKAGRERYLEKFTPETFHRNIEDAFLSVVGHHENEAHSS